MVIHIVGNIGDWYIDCVTGQLVEKTKPRYTCASISEYLDGVANFLDIGDVSFETDSRSNFSINGVSHEIIPSGRMMLFDGKQLYRFAGEPPPYIERFKINPTACFKIADNTIVMHRIYYYLTINILVFDKDGELVLCRCVSQKAEIEYVNPIGSEALLAKLLCCGLSVRGLL